MIDSHYSLTLKYIQNTFCSFSLTTNKTNITTTNKLIADKTFELPLCNYLFAVIQVMEKNLDCLVNLEAKRNYF